MTRDQRVVHLKSIRQLLRQPNFSRRTSNGMAIFAVAFALAFSACLEKWGWGWTGDESIVGSILTILTASFGLTCMLCAMLPNRDAIHRRLEHEIADYEPADYASYDKLCAQFKNDGRLDIAAIEAWLAKEIVYVERPLTHPEYQVRRSDEP